MARAIPRSTASAIRGRNAAAGMIAWTEPICERPAVIPRPTHSVHLALAQPAMKTKSSLEPTMRSGTHRARPWRAYRVMGKRSWLVWWSRIWTRNMVEPVRTSGTGRDRLDG